MKNNGEECTFQPNINKSNTRDSNKPHYVNQRSIQETLDRMKRGREERDYKKKMTERGFGDSSSGKKPQMKKQPIKRPTNYARPQIKKDTKTTRVATIGTKSRVKKEESKTYSQQKSAKVRRSAADRNRLAKPTQSSQRKAISKNQDKKEVRVNEHQKYDFSQEDQINPEQMYRKIEREEQEIHDKIAQDPNEYPQVEEEDQQPIGQYIEEPQDYEGQDFNQQESPEGEDYPQDYEGQDEENEGEGNPLLFVDVNLGPGRAERIVVYDGDTADELADEFTKKHGLDESLKEKLVKLLENQIAGLLGPINEGEDEDTSNGTEN